MSVLELVCGVVNWWRSIGLQQPLQIALLLHQPLCCRAQLAEGSLVVLHLKVCWAQPTAQQFILHLNFQGVLKDTIIGLIDLW